MTVSCLTRAYHVRQGVHHLSECGQGMECFCVTIRSIDLGPGTFSFGIIAASAKMDNIERIVRGFTYLPRLKLLV